MIEQVEMDILICTVEGQQIGLALNKVHSVVLAVETMPLPNAPHHFLGAINVHGEITCVIDMRKLLGLKAKELDINDQFILCNIHQKQVALWVDCVKNIKQVKTDEFIPAEQVFSLNHPSVLLDNTNQFFDLNIRRTAACVSYPL